MASPRFTLARRSVVDGSVTPPGLKRAQLPGPMDTVLLSPVAQRRSLRRRTYTGFGIPWPTIRPWPVHRATAPAFAVSPIAQMLALGRLTVSHFKKEQVDSVTYLTVLLIDNYYALTLR
jgi:hypothetical protein